MTLKLPRLPDRNPVRLTVGLPPDLHQALSDYAALYAETYGRTEAVADLVPYMLQGFVESDRAFRSRRGPAN